MSIFKECRCVLLPISEKAPQIGMISTRSDNNKLQLVDKELVDMYVFHQQFGDFVSAIPFQHLYITSDEEIKEGDWFVTDDRDRKDQNNGIPVYSLYKCTSIFNKWIGIENNDFVGYNPDWSKKIIASTDTNLHLAEMTYPFVKSFIEAYNNHTPIMKVMVEYEEIHSDDISNFMLGNPSEKLVLKLTDNTINIKSIKDSWTREEVKRLMMRTAIHVVQSYKRNTFFPGGDGLEKWINENL